MPAPPILEIYVVSHPDDTVGQTVSEWLIEHFHGPAYSGLAGGAVEVYVRSSGWMKVGGAPRPLPFIAPLPARLPTAQITVVLLVMGRGLARAVRDEPAWRAYVESICAADEAADSTADENVVAVLSLPTVDMSGTILASIAGRSQSLPSAAARSAEVLAREVAQAISQRVARQFVDVDLDERVTVFISHTKHGAMRADNPLGLVATIRQVLLDTHLDSFFDAHDIQVTEDWEKRLDNEASRHALLMVRTDQYAGREWTQREVLAAKRRDIPIVSLYAVRAEEQRGSFLMDHVPVVACPPGDERSTLR